MNTDEIRRRVKPGVAPRLRDAGVVRVSPGALPGSVESFQAAQPELAGANAAAAMLAKTISTVQESDAFANLRQRVELLEKLADRVGRLEHRVGRLERKEASK